MRPLLVLVLLASLVTAGCSGSGGTADRDGDGLPDGHEETPRTIVVNTLAGPTPRSVTSDPRSADTDADTIPDGVEDTFGLDPGHVDTDGDGYLDGADIELDPASERATEWRGLRILEDPPGKFLGELSRCPEFGGLKPNHESSDRPVPDKIADGAERLGWDVTLQGVTRHVVSDPCYSDADRDNLLDHDERDAGSDPNLADSDGDGTPDGADADPAADLWLLLRDVTATTKDGTPARVQFAVGTESATLAGERSGQVQVDDQTSQRGSLVAAVLVTAFDSEGNLLVLTPERGGAILTLDLVQGTGAVGDAARQPLSRFSFTGEDGSLSFEWAKLRS